MEYADSRAVVRDCQPVKRGDESIAFGWIVHVVNEVGCPVQQNRVESAELLHPQIDGRQDGLPSSLVSKPGEAITQQPGRRVGKPGTPYRPFDAMPKIVRGLFAVEPKQGAAVRVAGFKAKKIRVLRVRHRRGGHGTDHG